MKIKPKIGRATKVFDGAGDNVLELKSRNMGFSSSPQIMLSINADEKNTDND